MISTCKLVCPNNNPAHKLCPLSSCLSPSSPFLCDTITCSCSQTHASCHFLISTQDLFKSMNEKGKGYIYVLKMLLDWYDRLIEKMILEKDQILKIIEEPSLALGGSEGELYWKLKMGKLQEIQKGEVVDVFCILANQPKICLTELHLNQVKKMCFEQDKIIENILDRIKKQTNFHNSQLKSTQFVGSKKQTKNQRRKVAQSLPINVQYNTGARNPFIQANRSNAFGSKNN